MLIRKDKIMGLQVYDRKGRYVGTVKDIGFVLGENLVGIVVAGRDGREIEFIWSEVDAAEDIVILKKEVNIPAVPTPKKVEETKATKEQIVVSPPKPQPITTPTEPEVQIAPKGGTAEVSGAPSFKEPVEYDVAPSEQETEGAGPQPSLGVEKVEEEIPSNTKTCPKCGAINNARYKFCFRCGTRLPS